jgi:hypothetical protein
LEISLLVEKRGSVYDQGKIDQYRQDQWRETEDQQEQEDQGA